MKLRVDSLVAATLAVALAAGNVEAAEQGACDVRVAVELTPDVPNARDPGFLDSLMADPSFLLTWVSDTDSGIVVDLTGPGPGERCKDALKELSRNTHVLNVTVLPAGDNAHGSPGIGVAN